MLRVGPNLTRDIAAIADIINADPDRLADRIINALSATIRSFNDRGTFIRYTRLSGPLTQKQADAIRDLKVPGLHLEPIPIRQRLTDQTLATLVGRLSEDPNQSLGLEATHHQTLAPSPGTIEFIRDARGRPMWAIRDRIKPAAKGDSIRLSIDLTIQHIVREELERALTDTDAAGARCILIDPQTGHLLAAVDIVANRDDLTEFDPNNPDHTDTEAASRYRFRIIPPLASPSLPPDADPAIRRNRLVHDPFEPGSIFKPFTWATALQAGAVTIDETFTVNYGQWRTPYGRTIRDVVDSKKELNYREVLVRSSNIGLAQATARLTNQQLRNALDRFGFGEPTTLAIPGERAGILVPQSRWNKYTQTSVAFGQEITTTPAQLVAAFAAFARTQDRAGTIPTLTYFADPIANNPTAPNNTPNQRLATPVISPQVATLAREAMAEVAENVKKRTRQIHPEQSEFIYQSFGKTGTAQVARPNARGYLERQYISSYIAAAPLQQPRIALVVVIDDPGPQRIDSETHYGSATAAPPALRIIDRTLAYLRIPHQPTPQSTLAQTPQPTNQPASQ